MFATILPWVSMAPLATPVVPPVYCKNAMSSWLHDTPHVLLACTQLQRFLKAYPTAATKIAAPFS